MNVKLLDAGVFFSSKGRLREAMKKYQIQLELLLCNPLLVLPGRKKMVGKEILEHFCKFYNRFLFFLWLRP
jgi:hypothetical protein